MTKPEASASYTATRFGYAFNARTVVYAMGETWEWNGQATSCPTNYNIEWAREFRYDGARARYLNRELDPVALMSGNFVSLGDTWTDYDGDSAYGDFEVTPGYPPTVTNRRSYEPGLGQVDPWMSSGGTATDYMMSDHLGTTRGLIAPNNIPTDAAVYTAFGERISGTNHRFGYAGAWGYQQNADFPYLHVGARYYDPATGRFLQRDPIGIRGGLNKYAYVYGLPSAMVDPLGFQALVPPKHVPVSPAPMPPFKEIPDTPAPNLPPAKDLATACNQLNSIWFGQPLLPPVQRPGPPCSCMQPPYDGHHLHAAPPPPPPGNGPCGSGGGSGGGSAGAFLWILMLRQQRRSRLTSGKPCNLRI